VTETWTIAELTAQVAAALTDRDAPESGRVRAVPDERAVRYYTSLGLLDRPALRGRTALYGRRHLAQLVAIKREQARGASLAEIQRTLPTLDDAALTALAGVEVAPRPAPIARAGFWKAPPATTWPCSATTGRARNSRQPSKAPCRPCVPPGCATTCTARPRTRTGITWPGFCTARPAISTAWPLN